MSTTTSATPARDSSWVGGAVLIAIGAFLLLMQLVQPSGPIVLGGLAVLFGALYAGTRKHGFLVPAMILGGLAVGIAVEQAGYGLRGSAVVLGLAGGFLGIYVVNTLTGLSGHWWPLVPGGILALVGGSQALTGTRGAELVGDWWPLMLILLGIWIVLRERRPTSHGPATSQ